MRSLISARPEVNCIFAAEVYAVDNAHHSGTQSPGSPPPAVVGELCCPELEPACRFAVPETLTKQQPWPASSQARHSATNLLSLTQTELLLHAYTCVSRLSHRYSPQSGKLPGS